MANLPLRRLGDIGIITDLHPFDLPPNALSQGSNIRCKDGKIVRAPVFRGIMTTSASIPVFSWTYAVPGQDNFIGIADKTGTLYFISAGGTETDVTPSSFTPSASDSPHTDCILANLNYINRETAVPMYYAPASTDFDELPNWDSTWRCKSLRTYRDQLIALNITKGATNYPQMVKASDITTINTYPGSWDHTLANNSAYENVINECRSAFLDGLTLRDVFIIYSEDQTFLLEYTGDSDVFAIRKLWDNTGIIGVNCVVEVEGKHYVFGKKDLYVHDGVAFESIVTGRNHKYIFDAINYSQSKKFFVRWNPLLREVMFCYVSGDGQAAFVGVDYCNKAACYNVDGGQWTFRDLPNAGVATLAALSLSQTYATTTATYDTIGGSYDDMEDSSDKTLFFPSPASTPGGLTASRLYGYDEASGGRLTHAINTQATKKAWMERIGVDLDETGESINTYKVVRSVFPQGSALQETGNFYFKFAGSLFPDPTITLSWSTLQSFDPATQYKIDVNKGGRYLSWYFENPSLFGHELSGFDSDVVVTGRK